MGTSHEGKTEKIFYISYYRDGKRHFEKAGRQYRDDMTASRASRIRGAKIEGTELPNKARREEEAAKKASEAGRWTFDRLWAEWKAVNATKKGIVNDDNRYRTHLQPLFGHKEPKEVTSFERGPLAKPDAEGERTFAGPQIQPEREAEERTTRRRRKKNSRSERRSGSGNPTPSGLSFPSSPSFGGLHPSERIGDYATDYPSK